MEEEQKKKRFRPTLAEYVEVQKKLVISLERCQDQENELNALRKANALMEVELERVRNENASLAKKNDQLCAEIAVKSRNFLARLFNKIS